MKNSVVGLCLIIFLSSCVPTKDLIYLQDNGNSDNTTISQIPIAPYRLQESDVLSINISAIDSKLVEIFNPSTTTSAAITPESFYYKGYIVDAHGNIDLPILNQVSVIGLTTEEAKVKIENLKPIQLIGGCSQMFSNANSCVNREFVNKLVGNDDFNEGVFEYICKDCGDDFESITEQTSCANCNSYNIKKL